MSRVWLQRSMIEHRECYKMASKTAAILLPQKLPKRFLWRPNSEFSDKTSRNAQPNVTFHIEQSKRKDPEARRKFHVSPGLRGSGRGRRRRIYITSHEYIFAAAAAAAKRIHCFDYPQRCTRSLWNNKPKLFARTVREGGEGGTERFRVLPPPKTV